MQSTLEQYQEIVLKTVSLIRSNLDKPLSVPELAQQLEISNRQLLRAFQRILNQSVVDCIRSERIGRAKALLQQTQLSITSVAFESGFDSCAVFARTFREKVGTSPSDFRKKVLQINESPASTLESTYFEKKDEWFKDFFHSSVMGSHWKPIHGKWRQDQACLTGNENGHISLEKPLPENCSVSFLVKTQPNQHLGWPNIFFEIMDETHTSPYYGFAIATGKESIGQIAHYRAGNQWSAEACIKDSEWHRIAIEIKEEILSLSIDGARVSSFRDAFPPAYSRRCSLHIGSYHCSINIREFTIHNLGFSPAIHPIRQGDVLYNSGMVEKALEFFLRYLRAGSVTDEETMELRYKIGMCYLRAGSYLQARAWMDKVVSLPENKFWSQQTRLSLMELYWRAADMENLLDHMRNCLTDANLQNQARVILQTAIHDLWAKGFYMEAGRVLDAWLVVEQKNGPGYNSTASLVAENHQKMRRVEDAEGILHQLASAPRTGESALVSRINLMQLYHEFGRIGDSERARKEIEAATKDESALVRCTVQQALNLRAQEQFEQALIVLAELPNRHPEAERHFLSHAKIHSAFILCCLGRLEEGRNALEEARTVDPSFYLGIPHYLPFLLVEGNYGAAAEQLLAVFRNSKELVSASAELGIKAGILHELAGKDTDAKSIFKEVSLRFPNEQVRFLGPLAHALFAGEEFDHAAMPYEAHRRSELFFLLGLLRERRGEIESARTLFELSVKEDPPLRWPAYLAKQKLATR